MPEYEVYWRIVIEDSELVTAEDEEAAQEIVEDMLPSRLVGSALDSLAEVEVVDVEAMDDGEE